MAMTKCKECGSEISTKAEACPKCGAKVTKSSGCATAIIGFIGLIALFSVLSRCTSSNTNHTLTSQTSTTSTNQESSTPAPAPPPLDSQWSYEQSDDPMAKGTTHIAAVQSKNTVEFDFPYNGPQRAMLALRTHPRYGKDVVFKIERGQFLCRSYEDCTILVRFDDQKAQSFSAIGSSDNSTETIFIRNYSRFVSGMQKAKTVRIAAEIYQQGAPVFEFDVSGFDQSKYKPSK